MTLANVCVDFNMSLSSHLGLITSCLCLLQGSSREDIAALHTEISKLIARNDELTAAVFSLQEAHRQLKEEKEEEEAKCAALEEELREKEDRWQQTEQQLNAEVCVWGGGWGYCNDI